MKSNQVLKNVVWLNRLALFVGALSISAGVAGCAVVATPPTADEVRALAPTGNLRVGVFPGSATKDVTYDLGKALAARLGVGFELVEVKTLNELLDAVKAGKVDFTGTNASPARAKIMDFTSTVLDIELGYLVLTDAGIATMADMDRPGLRVGVSQGSTSQTTLPTILKSAIIVPVATLKLAAEMLGNQNIDVFATNKSYLLDMSDGIKGSRLVDGNWGVEHWAVGVPKGREKGLMYLQQFADRARLDGVVKNAVERSGVRGIVIPQI